MVSLWDHPEQPMQVIVPVLSFQKVVSSAVRRKNVFGARGEDTVLSPSVNQKNRWVLRDYTFPIGKRARLSSWHCTWIALWPELCYFPSLGFMSVCCLLFDL